MGGIAASIGWGINHPEQKVSAGWAATAFILAFEFSFGLGYVNFSVLLLNLLTCCTVVVQSLCT